MTDAAPEFTGKERDVETGLDYFGARYFSGVQGRFTSPDPIIDNALRRLNPQRWNRYAYGINSPQSFVDPDGRDAIAVGFATGAGGLGHNGIAAVRPDGTVRFGDFGPAGGARPYGKGEYTVFTARNKLVFGSDGLPTQASLKAVAQEVGERTLYSADSISFAYYRTSVAETQALDSFLNIAQLRQANGLQSPYVLTMYDCRHFCMFGLNAAGIGTAAQSFLTRSPNVLIQELRYFSANLYYDSLYYVKYANITEPSEACTTIPSPKGPDTKCGKF